MDCNNVAKSSILKDLHDNRTDNKPFIMNTFERCPEVLQIIDLKRVNFFRKRFAINTSQPCP